MRMMAMLWKKKALDAGKAGQDPMLEYMDLSQHMARWVAWTAPDRVADAVPDGRERRGPPLHSFRV